MLLLSKIRCANASGGRTFPRMTSIQGQSGHEENNFVFGFWPKAGENVDFVIQYLANNRIFGDAKVVVVVVVVFCAKYTFLLIYEWRKWSFDTFLNHVYGSLRAHNCQKYIKKWILLHSTAKEIIEKKQVIFLFRIIFLKLRIFVSMCNFV